MTGQTGQENDLSGPGDGRQDGKTMTGQTNILTAKLPELTLTRTSDPSRPMSCGII